MPYTYTVLHANEEIARAVSDRIDQAMAQGKANIPAGYDHAELVYEMIDIYGQLLSGFVDSPVRFN